MEDFTYARLGANEQPSGLQAEWLENNFKTNITNISDSCLSFAVGAMDKQEPLRKQADSSGQTEAQELDKDLNDFANTKLSDPSHDMLRFQDAVSKFCKAADKAPAFDQLGDTWTSITSLSNLKAEALSRQIRVEAANTPGRKELNDELKQKQDDMNNRIDDLPVSETMRITDLMIWKDGETQAEHDARVRKGLASDKPVLDAYNDVCAVESKIEANRGPREKQLYHLSEQLDAESRVMNDEVEKAYLRSTIKN